MVTCSGWSESNKTYHGLLTNRVRTYLFVRIHSLDRISIYYMLIIFNNYATLKQTKNMTVFEIADYKKDYFVWMVQVYGSNLNDSNSFSFTLEGGHDVAQSQDFNITYQSKSDTMRLKLRENF